MHETQNGAIPETIPMHPYRSVVALPAPLYLLAFFFSVRSSVWSTAFGRGCVKTRVFAATRHFSYCISDSWIFFKAERSYARIVARIFCVPTKLIARFML